MAFPSLTSTTVTIHIRGTTDEDIPARLRNLGETHGGRIPRSLAIREVIRPLIRGLELSDATLSRYVGPEVETGILNDLISTTPGVGVDHTPDGAYIILMGGGEHEC